MIPTHLVNVISILLMLLTGATAPAENPSARGAEEARVKMVTPESAASPAPSTAVSVKRIEVNLTTQHLVGWEDDRVAFEYAVTTGQEGQSTLPGEYEILDKEDNPYSTAWAMTMPYWMGVYQYGDFENGFHALPIKDSGEILWDDALGVYPASHGCIVLATSDAQHLYEWAEVGTRVEIHD